MTDTQTLEDFRQEVRDFLGATLSPQLAERVRAGYYLSKPELDAETRKEFRKIADRLDGLQRRMEEIIKL